MVAAAAAAVSNCGGEYVVVDGTSTSSSDVSPEVLRMLSLSVNNSVNRQSGSRCTFALEVIKKWQLISAPKMSSLCSTVGPYFGRAQPVI